MFKINADSSIELTRGDTAEIIVPLQHEEGGKTYEMQPGDVLRLTLKRSKYDNEAVLQKVSKGSNIIHIQPADTKNLDFAKYKYDIELTTESGDVYTVIPFNTFKIAAEVTT